MIRKATEADLDAVIKHELRLDTNERNDRAREMYRKLGYKEIGIVPTVFNGIPNVNLVLLEKRIITPSLCMLI